MNPEFSYWSNAADDVLPVDMRVSQAGVCTLRIGSNRDNTRIPNAGVFRMELARRQMAPLLKALQGQAFAEVRNPESVAPGEVVRRLTLREADGAAVMRFVAESAAAPAAFVQAEKLALNLIEIVRQRPQVAVMLAVAPLPPRIDRGQPVKVEVALINPGPVPIRLPHPEEWAQRQVQLQLSAIRNDVPTADLRSHHQRFEQLSADDIQELRPKGPAAPTIVVAAGQRVTLVGQKLLDWPPGRYDVSIAWQGPLFDTDGREVVRCEVVSKIFKMICAGQPKPEDAP